MKFSENIEAREAPRNRAMDKNTNRKGPKLASEEAGEMLGLMAIESGCRVTDKLQSYDQVQRQKNCSQCRPCTG